VCASMPNMWGRVGSACCCSGSCGVDCEARPLEEGELEGGVAVRRLARAWDATSRRPAQAWDTTARLLRRAWDATARRLGQAWDAAARRLRQACSHSRGCGCGHVVAPCGSGSGGHCTTTSHQAAWCGVAVAVAGDGHHCHRCHRVVMAMVVVSGFFFAGRTGPKCSFGGVGGSDGSGRLCFWVGEERTLGDTLCAAGASPRVPRHPHTSSLP